MLNVINISRFQFALTAMYHFIFVSLTLGILIIIAIIETIYVISNDKIYKNIAMFFGKIFSVFFAFGVSTGIIMEFQFGTNWSNFSNYIGNILGVPLVLEALLAFFLESTLIGLFLFGWKILNKFQHLIITWLIVIGSNMSALWIIIANGWMQNPISCNLNINNMTLEINNYYDLIFNRVSQVKFFHTVMSCYCVGSIFILGISSYYLINNIYYKFSKISYTISSIFGFFVIILTLILGDESGFEINKIQKSKLAAIEAEWETNKPPSNLNIFCFPSQKYKKNYFEFKIPYLSGILVTRSLNKKIIGLKEIIDYNKIRIINGIKSIILLKKIKLGNYNYNDIKKFNMYKKDIGFGFMFYKYFNNIKVFNKKHIDILSENLIPNVLILFFSFRIMVLFGLILFILLILCFLKSINNTFSKNKWIYKFCIISIPIPIIASQCGWIISEYGRQPWIIYEIFPTNCGVSYLNISNIIFSTFIIILLYIIFSILLIYIIINIIKNGPKNVN